MNCILLSQAILSHFHIRTKRLIERLTSPLESHRVLAFERPHWITLHLLANNSSSDPSLSQPQVPTNSLFLLPINILVWVAIIMSIRLLSTLPSIIYPSVTQLHRNPTFIIDRSSLHIAPVRFPLDDPATMPVTHGLSSRASPSLPIS